MPTQYLTYPIIATSFNGTINEGSLWDYATAVGYDADVDADEIFRNCYSDSGTQNPNLFEVEMYTHGAGGWDGPYLYWAPARGSMRDSVYSLNSYAFFWEESNFKNQDK